MTRITNVDQVLLLLRSHLQRAERSQRKGAKKTERLTAEKQTRLERVHSIAHSEALSEDEIERTLISGLLAEEFGSTAANDPKFQLLVDEVTAMLRQEPAGRTLLAKAVGELIEGHK